MDQICGNRKTIDLDCKAGDPKSPIGNTRNSSGIDYGIVSRTRDFYRTLSATSKLGTPLEYSISFEARFPIYNLHSTTNFICSYIFFVEKMNNTPLYWLASIHHLFQMFAVRSEVLSFT
ncbi:hypothetical protein AVEN_101614-1 [Araneus ventricosus]|uniref:Uncharacterized protein n=1 Tax=Araneus ventricosus TaxID=182803 RepID=A0A4Y2EVM7_ARAVE|nr:hypothetical protein AVEN_101614-1 [Araneus ventricosus]